MTLGRLTRYAIILLPLVVCASKIHANRTRSPQGTTQEVSRCLTVMRAAAARRRNQQQRQLDHGREQTVEINGRDPRAA